jgi:putative transcriptional regulator
MLRATAGLVACLLLSGAARGPSPDRDPALLRPGLFLYAAPGIADPRFAESVVLLVQHGPEGSMGLVVNRPTEMPLREAIEKIEEARGSDLRVYWGGPVQPEAILALVRSPRASPGAQAVLADVHLTGDLADVRAALTGQDPAGRLRVYSGYAGWTAGQLPAEVRAGVWVLDRADAASVFAPDPSKLWPRVHDILNRLEVRHRPAPTQTQTVTHVRRERSRLAWRRAPRGAARPARSALEDDVHGAAAGVTISLQAVGGPLCHRIGRAGSDWNLQSSNRPPRPPSASVAMTKPFVSSRSAKDVRSTEPA